MIKRTDVVFGAGFLVVGLLAVVAIGRSYLLAADASARAQTWSNLGLAFVFGLGCTVLGAVFLTIGLREVWREARLRRVGTATEGSVVGHERTNSRVNRKYLWKVRYTYNDLAGLTHEGRSGYFREAEAREYAVGDKVLVRYDPVRPSSSIWLGRVDESEKTGG